MEILDCEAEDASWETVNLSTEYERSLQFNDLPLVCGFDDYLLIYGRYGHG